MFVMRRALLLAGLVWGVVALAGCHGTMMRETGTPGLGPVSVSEKAATATPVATAAAVVTPDAVGTATPAPPFAIVDTPAAVAAPSPVGPPTAVATPTPVPTPGSVLTPTPVPTAMAVETLERDEVAAEEARAVVIGGERFGVEVAVTPEERRVGLSGRESLAADAGMLFAFEGERMLSFWMKDTLIPLDIVFIDGDRRIVDVQTMTPELDVATRDLTVYQSAEPARYALEVNAGVAEELGLRVGMEVVFE